MTRAPAVSRLPLSHGRIIAAATDLLDRDGLNALTMRRLGAELSVEAMSLYAYVDSKQALLQDVREALFQQMEGLSTTAGDWQHRLRSVMNATRTVGLLHPCLALLITTVNDGPVGRVRHLTDMATLREAGFDEGEALEAITALVGFVIGHIIIETTSLVMSSNRERSDRSFRLGLDALFNALEMSAAAFVATQKLTNLTLHSASHEEVAQ